MRPLKLALKGFTAFRDPVEIDFTPLEVFAISGPTGSGKSSLLDAMTYALYGRVERVGAGVGQLVSQGQPRMAVSLEFEVGRDRYRVTRSTPAARGSTKILLEREAPDGQWRQAGEGADRVRDAERMLREAIGLTYDGFTRSVLLPQGRFAEFMVGDQAKRREILTELLGLALFRRMAERAGAIAKESSIRAQTMTDVLDREFADATPQALKEARAAAKETRRRERDLTAAAADVTRMLAEWQEAIRSADELAILARDAAAAARRSEALGGELEELAGQLGQSLGRLSERTAAWKAAGRAAAAARTALQKAQAALGGAQPLSEARLWAHSLAQATEARGGAEAERAQAVRNGQSLEAALERAAREAHERLAELDAREVAAVAAEEALLEAQHADMVATVSAGLRVGDPCPVCGQPLERAPRRRGAGALRSATGRRDGARMEVERARRALSDAERAGQALRHQAGSNTAALERFGAVIAGLDRKEADERARLIDVLGDPLPPDPGAEVDGRLARLSELDRVERGATREEGDAERARAKAEQERDRFVGEIERRRDLLLGGDAGLLERAARALGPDTLLPAPSALPSPERASPDDLATHARSVAHQLSELGRRLDRQIEQRASIEARLSEQAFERVRGLVESAPSLQAVAAAVTEGLRDATAQVATAVHLADDLASRVERRKRIGAEAKGLEERSLRFRSLAQELRADRLIAYLQTEALQVLAAAGSERLSNLSDGRYRLIHRDDEFLVTDTWNGDEERSVRTLSGGETFLASLALALALADQVRSLSVTDRARLDSLFLDEGFGALDPDALRIVVDAIEQLGGGGRLVGVITHLPELSEQFPRIEVEKSPRGSRLNLVQA